MYQNTTIYIDNKHEMYNYFEELAIKSNNLYNRANFIIRQIMTGTKKDKPLTNEQEVLDLFKNNLDKINEVKENAFNNKIKKAKKEERTKLKKKGYKKIKLPDSKNWYIGYEIMDTLLKVTEDYDYRNLPVHSAQKVLKQLNDNWKAYFAEIKDFKINPNKYTGMPRIPKYKTKGGYNIVKFSNKSCVIKNINGKNIIKFPNTKLVLNLGEYKLDKLIKIEVSVNKNGAAIFIVTDKKIDIPVRVETKAVAGIDLGVDNFATLTNNIGLSPILIKGKEIKAYNQFINKRISKLQSELKLKNNKYTSKQINRLYTNRYRRFYNWFHFINNKIIDYLLENKIYKLVVGKNNEWKQNIDIGKSNNQKFCYIPYELFLKDLKYKCEINGILYIEREESYTSKASLLDLDEMPIYNKDENSTYKFSGKRIHRGLYKSAKGTLINADVNGSCNIIRKEYKDAFNGIDLKYLSNIKVWNISKLMNK